MSQGVEGAGAGKVVERVEVRSADSDRVACDTVRVFGEMLAERVDVELAGGRHVMLAGAGVEELDRQLADVQALAVKYQERAEKAEAAAKDLDTRYKLLECSNACLQARVDQQAAKLKRAGELVKGLLDHIVLPGRGISAEDWGDACLLSGRYTGDYREARPGDGGHSEGDSWRIAFDAGGLVRMDASGPGGCTFVVNDTQAPTRDLGLPADYGKGPAEDEWKAQLFEACKRHTGDPRLYYTVLSGEPITGISFPVDDLEAARRDLDKLTLVAPSKAWRRYVWDTVIPRLVQRPRSKVDEIDAFMLRVDEEIAAGRVGLSGMPGAAASAEVGAPRLGVEAHGSPFEDAVRRVHESARAAVRSVQESARVHELRDRAAELDRGGGTTYDGVEAAVEGLCSQLPLAGGKPTPAERWARIDPTGPDLAVAADGLRAAARRHAQRARDAEDAEYLDIATDVGKLVASKQRQYGDSAGRAGGILTILYPNGIPTHAYDDALLMVRVLDKLSRVAQRGEDGTDHGGESPWRDIMGYGLLGVRSDGRRSGEG